MDRLELTGRKKTWAEFSTLDLSVLVNAMQLLSLQKRPNLKWKTWTKPLLGYLSLAFALPA
jgi:hypothetical protein